MDIQNIVGRDQKRHAVAAVLGMHCVPLSSAEEFLARLERELQGHRFGQRRRDDFATFGWGVAVAATTTLGIDPVRDAVTLASIQADLYLAFTGRLYLHDPKLGRAYDRITPQP